MLIEEEVCSCTLVCDSSTSQTQTPVLSKSSCPQQVMSFVLPRLCPHFSNNQLQVALVQSYTKLTPFPFILTYEQTKPLSPD